MEWTQIILIIGIGFFAGFINTLAGSGSLLTLPLLIFMGLPANVANGTNRIAILLQNVVGVSSFKHQKVFDFKEGIWLALPAVVGSVIGAQLAVNINETMMKNIIGGLLIFMFFFLLLKPTRWLNGAENIQSKPNILQIIIFFVIGLYGGFIQAGVGFFLLAGLVLGSGFDLVKANAVKVFIVLIYTAFALMVFIINKQVNYTVGFVLAIGNMLGAFVAARYAVRLGAKFVRIILLVTLVVASAKMFGVF
ncbi:MAG: sulfite exporter TauE/SafE family protein [Bacteroidales bacterium]|nr:sulfite exporter TauE/SafE family protein [Bacteroidales bacterium]